MSNIDKTQEEILNEKKQAAYSKLAALNEVGFAKSKALRYWTAQETIRSTGRFNKYTRDTIKTYLEKPETNSVKIIDASIYFYSTVLLYKRICWYLSEMPTYDYIIAPKSKEFDTSEQSLDKYRKAYFKTLSMLENMNIKKNFSDIARTCIREGCYYGIEVSQNDSYAILQFPHDKCEITAIEDNVPLYRIDLSYFDNRATLIESIGGELEQAYRQYKDGLIGKEYEISSDISICIPFDSSVKYITPPLAGCFLDLFTIDEYQDIIAEQNFAELYKLLNLQLPTDDNGDLVIDEAVATKFYNQLAAQLPSFIGLSMSPFPLSAVNFDKSTVDRDMTSRATRDLFSNLGISQMIFNNEIGSTTALKKAIENDFSFMKPVLRNLEAWLNRKLKHQSGTIKFKAIFPDVSVYNRADYADSIRKDMQYGIPSKGLLAAVNYGYTPADTYAVNFLETSILKYQDTFIPPQSANTQSGGEAGRPESGDDIDEAGIKTQESEANM